MAFKILNEPSSGEAYLKLFQQLNGDIQLKVGTEAQFKTNSAVIILSITNDGRLMLWTGLTSACANGLRLNCNGRAIVFDTMGAQLLG